MNILIDKEYLDEKRKEIDIELKKAAYEKDKSKWDFYCGMSLLLSQIISHQKTLG